MLKGHHRQNPQAMCKPALFEPIKEVGLSKLLFSSGNGLKNGHQVCQMMPYT